MRTGRKRNPNVVRDDSGKSRGERFDPQPFLNQPHRKGFSDLEANQGFPLGRLFINGLLNADQLAAGNHYANCVYAYARTMGIPAGSPRSGALIGMQGGGFYRWEGEEGNIDPEESRKRLDHVKTRYNDCHDALAELGRVHKRGHKILNVMREICVAEVEEKAIWADQQKLGDLRLGLNSVHKILLGHKT